MALGVVFAEPFDHYASSPNAAVVLGLGSTWNPVLVSGSASTYASFITGFKGRGKALKLTAGTFSFRYQRNVPTSPLLSAHVAFRSDVWDGDNSQPFLRWRTSGASIQFSIRQLPNKTLALYRGDTTALLAQTAYQFTTGVPHRLNIWADWTTPASASFNMAIDGDINKGFAVAAQNLVAAPASAIELFSFGTNGGGSDVINCSWAIDDLMYCNGASQNIGEMELITTGPTGDVVKAFTPSTGTDNYALVDELPPSTADYNSSTVVGNIDLQSFPVLPTIPDSIFCVSQFLAANKEEAGTRTLAAVAHPVATDYVGANQNLTTTADWYYEHYLNNPETLAAWLAAERNAASFGYKDVA